MLKFGAMINSLVFILLITGSYAYASDCGGGARSQIVKDILGESIYSLYENYDFQKIEVDNEYADLKESEKYWLALDSNFEFMTLRTVNNMVEEIIIRNPDFRTHRGAYVGMRFESFKDLYPTARRLDSYQSGIRRPVLAYCVEEDSLEFSFVKNEIFSIRVLDRCR